MKKFISILILASFILPVLGSGQEWFTDMSKAQAVAKKEGKTILINFSGSDWCGWCIRLDEEVFSSDVFKEYAKKNLVLVVLDFPRRTAQAPELKAQNQQLAQKYQIRGFPTVLLVDASGKLLVRSGYRPGGSAAYVNFIKKSLSKG